MSSLLQPPSSRVGLVLSPARPAGTEYRNGVGASDKRIPLVAGQDRLQLTPSGRVVVMLKSAWADGPAQLLFESVEFLGKLAVLPPRPRINLLRYYVIFLYSGTTSSFCIDVAVSPA